MQQSPPTYSQAVDEILATLQAVTATHIKHVKSRMLSKMTALLARHREKLPHIHRALAFRTVVTKRPQLTAMLVEHMVKEGTLCPFENAADDGVKAEPDLYMGPFIFAARTAAVAEAMLKHARTPADDADIIRVTCSLAIWGKQFCDIKPDQTNECVRVILEFMKNTGSPCAARALFAEAAHNQFTPIVEGLVQAGMVCPFEKIDGQLHGGRLLLQVETAPVVRAVLKHARVPEGHNITVAWLLVYCAQRVAVPEQADEYVQAILEFITGLDDPHMCRAVFRDAVNCEYAPVIEYLVREGHVCPFEWTDHYGHGHHTYIALAESAAVVGAMLRYARVPEATAGAACGLMTRATFAATFQEPAAEEVVQVILDFISSSPELVLECGDLWFDGLTMVDTSPYLLDKVAKAGIPLLGDERLIQLMERKLLPVNAFHKLAELGRGPTVLKVHVRAAPFIRAFTRRSAALEVLDLLLAHGNQTMRDRDWLRLLRACTPDIQLPTRVLQAVPQRVWQAFMHRMDGPSRMHLASQLYVGRVGGSVPSGVRLKLDVGPDDGRISCQMDATQQLVRLHVVFDGKRDRVRCQLYTTQHMRLCQHLYARFVDLTWWGWRKAAAEQKWHPEGQAVRGLLMSD